MTLDDLLVEGGHIVPFHRSGRPSRRWGRYGNELLIQGDSAFAGEATMGDADRLRRSGGRVVLRLPDASVAGSVPARCAQCGMKLVPANAVATPAQGGPIGHDHGDSFEWEHLMPEINRASDPSNIIWAAHRRGDRCSERVHSTGRSRLGTGSNPAGQRGGLRSSNAPPVLLSAQTMAAGVSNSVSDTYASVCANSHPCISSLSLPSSSAIGRQITDVVTSGGQSSTKFVLRTIGACSRRERFAVPVTLTVS
jgi:hypothetical protein